MRNQIDAIWKKLMDVNYISPKPSDQFGFQAPRQPRQDNGASANQPWYHGSNFGAADPSHKTVPIKARVKK